MTAFLEFATPTLEESILSCVDKGADEIVISPYFLASGNHVTRDIPQVVKIKLKEHLGSSSDMVRLLSNMAE